MSVTAFEDVKNHQTRNIRKMLEGSIFMKRWEATDPQITQVYAAASGLIIPPGYFDVGVIKKSDAIKWNRDTDSADVESWGYGEPTRRDLTKDVSTMQFTMQESKRRTLEVYNSVDLSAVTPDTDGNVVIDKPNRPQALRWRAFSLAKDGDGADAIYFLKALPNCQVSAITEQSWSDADELAYGVTLTGFNDRDWGTAVREIWGGPGLDLYDTEFLEAEAWEATTAYTVGNRVIVGAGVLRATTAGTSGATAPTLPALVGGTVTDGDVEWQRIS